MQVTLRQMREGFVCLIHIDYAPIAAVADHEYML